MIKVIDERNDERRLEVYDGQVREDREGRIIMVITDDRFHQHRCNDSVLKLLILKEGLNGCGKPFTTVPSEDYSEEDVIKLYPKVLDSKLIIEGGN